MSFFLDPKRVFPPEASISPGNPLLIKCDSHHIPRWTFNDGNLPTNAHVDEGALSFKKVDIANQGLYECQGTLPQGTFFYAESFLKVLGNIKIKLSIIYIIGDYYHYYV